MSLPYIDEVQSYKEQDLTRDTKQSTRAFHHLHHSLYLMNHLHSLTSSTWLTREISLLLVY